MKMKSTSFFLHILEIAFLLPLHTVCLEHTLQLLPIDVRISYREPGSDDLVEESLATGRLVSCNIKELRGVVLLANGNNGSEVQACTSLDPDVVSIAKEEQVILLAEEGGCPLAVKMKLAAEAKAVALLIYGDDAQGGDVDNEALLHTLPILLPQSAGLQLTQLVDRVGRVWAVVGKARPLMPRLHPAFLLLLPPLLVVCAWGCFHRLMRLTRPTGRENAFPRQICAVARKALEKIPVKVVKDNVAEANEYSDNCSICMETFEYGELIRSLPCKHGFHKACVDQWLLERRSCPLCKLDIMDHFGLVYTGSRESVIQLEDDDDSTSTERHNDDDGLHLLGLERHRERRKTSVGTLVFARRPEDARSRRSLDSCPLEGVVVERVDIRRHRKLSVM